MLIADNDLFRREAHSRPAIDTGKRPAVCSVVPHRFNRIPNIDFVLHVRVCFLSFLLRLFASASFTLLDGLTITSQFACSCVINSLASGMRNGAKEGESSLDRQGIPSPPLTHPHAPTVPVYAPSCRHSPASTRHFSPIRSWHMSQ